jgi:hypothetical protein
MNKIFLHKSKVLCTGILLLMAVSCNNSKGGDTAATDEDTYVPNDIAMTIRSLADAINIGEPLDSASYDFEGVMTDGRGAPLYTNMRGAPGEWSVIVTDEKSAVVRNLDLGDLLPDDLREYVTDTMGLGEENVVEAGTLESDEETEVVTYDIGEGLMRFETRPEVASNGLEGVWLSIVIKKW